ncbi:hypothetical protein M569_11259, partial [Genlisea aurea]
LFFWSHEWPELVGVDVEVAVLTILTDNPTVNVVLVPENSLVTFDLCCNRVWLYYDSQNRVSAVPLVG